MFSKSKGNGVDPLEIIEQGYGADALRIYLMFAAPLDQWVRWDPQGVPGAFRFLSRLWNITHDYLEADKDSGDNKVVLSFAHRAIKKVTDDLEQNKYNTAIATMMKLTNDLYIEKAKNGFKGSNDWQFAIESLVQLVAPLAPHIAEELWQQLGHSNSVNKDSWPKWDERLVAEEVITLAVQINGKVRSEIVVPADISETDAIESAQNDEKIAQIIDGQTVKKAIYVPGRLVSLVI
jgi:leucyl-tRNA synthetase